MKKVKNNKIYNDKHSFVSRLKAKQNKMRFIHLFISNYGLVFIALNFLLGL